jgi:hypothetical protein
MPSTWKNTSTKKVTPASKEELNFISSLGYFLPIFAWGMYQRFGRGFLLIDRTIVVSSIHGLSGPLFAYAYDDTLLDIPETIKNKVDMYDPRTGFVVVLNSSKGMSVYGTRTLPTPPDAYAKLKEKGLLKDPNQGPVIVDENASERLRELFKKHHHT